LTVGFTPACDILYSEDKPDITSQPEEESDAGFPSDKAAMERVQQEASNRAAMERVQQEASNRADDREEENAGNESTEVEHAKNISKSSVLRENGPKITL
jgi:hypothetical protein